jgi:hypothetical protein
MWQCGGVLSPLRDRLKNLFQALIRLLRPGYCPLTGHNPGLLLACLLDIIPWKTSVHNGAEQQSLMKGVWSRRGCLSSCFMWVWSLGLTHTYLGSFFLDPKDVRSIILGAVWNFSKGTGLPWLGQQIMGCQGPVQQAHMHWEQKGLNSFLLFCSILKILSVHSTECLLDNKD